MEIKPNVALLKKAAKELNDMPVMAELELPKIKYVGVKGAVLLDDFLYIVTKIGEEGLETVLSDFIVNTYNDHLPPEEPESAPDEEPGTEPEDNEPEPDDNEGDFITKNEIHLMRRKELAQLIVDHTLDIKLKEYPKLADLREAAITALFDEPEPEPEPEPAPVKRSSRASKKAPAEKEEPATVPPAVKKVPKNEEAKSKFGHILTKQTGQMDVLLEKGATYNSIMGVVDNQPKDIARHLRRLKKKGFKIFKKDHNDPFEIRYRVEDPNAPVPTKK